LTIQSCWSSSGRRVRRSSRFPEDGAFAGVVDEDEGLLAGAAGSGEEVGFDAGASEFGAVERGGVVIADFADVTRAQAPVLAGDHGGGNLAAEQNLRGTKFDFGAAGRIVGDGDEGVGGVEADADDVEFGECVMMVPATVKEAREFSKA